MVIDVNVHPLPYRSIYDEDAFAFWEREFGMGLMNPMDYDELFVEMSVGASPRMCYRPLA